MTITEGKALINASHGKLSKKLPVFYNPVMKFNRDISISLLNALGKKSLRIADSLAGSGVRAVRFMLELDKGIVEHLAINDYSAVAVNAINKNFRKNKLSTAAVSFHCGDASIFLLESSGFDYIDIDPFGTPNPFLDAAIKRIARDGILAITATDIAALAGTAAKACRRKYWAEPLRNELMHDVGLRILIRKVQLVGVQYDKALFPVLALSRDHYYRIFFRCDKSKEACDAVVKQHQTLLFCSACRAFGFVKMCSCSVSPQLAGPLWSGELFDKKLLMKMKANSSELESFLAIARREAAYSPPGFYDLHVIGGRHKVIPRTEFFIDTLKKNGFIAVPTHLSAHCVRTNASIKKINQLFFGRQSLQRN